MRPLDSVSALAGSGSSSRSWWWRSPGAEGQATLWPAALRRGPPRSGAPTTWSTPATARRKGGRSRSASTTPRARTPKGSSGRSPLPRPRHLLRDRRPDRRQGGALARNGRRRNGVRHHSYTHPRGLATEGKGATLELQAANAAIQRASGFRPCLFRPPYGALTPDLIQRAKEAELTTAKWTVDPADWTHPGVEAIRERVLAGAKPGAIVVMHDNIETRGQTVKALPGILEGLQARGYRMVTISQLLGDKVVWGRT
jgi:Polysaccharide deacetylase